MPDRARQRLERSVGAPDTVGVDDRGGRLERPAGGLLDGRPGGRVSDGRGAAPEGVVLGCGVDTTGWAGVAGATGAGVVCGGRWVAVLASQQGMWQRIPEMTMPQRNPHSTHGAVSVPATGSLQPVTPSRSVYGREVNCGATMGASCGAVPDPIDCLLWIVQPVWVDPARPVRGAARTGSVTRIAGRGCPAAARVGCAIGRVDVLLVVGVLADHLVQVQGDHPSRCVPQRGCGTWW